MRIVLMILGLVCLGLGAVGAALPVLPTTPFLLVSAVCFARSSERLNTWFRGTALYQKNLESLTRGEGMTRGAKLRIMRLVTLVMGIAFLAMQGTTGGRICIAVVWVCHVIAFTFFIKTCPEK